MSFNGDEYVDRLTVQRSTRQSASLRTVLGAEVSQERDVSEAYFDGFGQVATQFEQVFGSAEWRVTDTLLLNAGALAERSGLGGDSVSPRLMLNWHLAPGHTLRFGGSTAFRPPSAYEKYAQVRYYEADGTNPTGYYVYNNGSLSSEKLVSSELGYFYAALDQRFNMDVRMFNEKIIDGIAHTDPQGSNTPAVVYVNQENYQINGVEWQMNWTPTPADRIFFSQTWTDIPVDSSIPGETLFRTQQAAPKYADSLMLAHTFDDGWQVSVMRQAADSVALMSTSTNQWLWSMARTDLRIAKAFRMGRNKVEAAMVIQDLNSPYQDGDWKFRFEQRTMLTLKIEN